MITVSVSTSSGLHPKESEISHGPGSAHEIQFPSQSFDIILADFSPTGLFDMTALQPQLVRTLQIINMRHHWAFITPARTARGLAATVDRVSNIMTKIKHLRLLLLASSHVLQRSDPIRAPSS